MPSGTPSRRTPRAALAALAVSAGVAQASVALPPLSENARITSEFFAAAVGDEIRKNCPQISARLFRVWRRANALKSYARSLGYSDSDMAAMRKDPAARTRLKEMRDRYLAAKGVTKGDTDSYCRLGYEEIERNSLAGWLLRAD